MTSPLHILHLEDNPTDAELAQAMLEADGIECEVTRVETRADFLAAVEQGGFDLILADYSLPSFDGLSALEIARDKRPKVPFIFLSGTLGEEVAIESLKGGARDYVLKDRLARLASSVRRALRESEERTARQRAEERLRLQATALDAAANAIFITDRQGVIEWVNPAFSQITGYTLEEAVGRTPRILKSGQYTRAFYKTVWDTILAGEVWQAEMVNRKRDGGLFTVQQTITPLRNAQGEISHFVAIQQDITKRKQAEQALADSEKRFRALIESAPDGISLLGVDGKIVYASPATQHILGFAPEEAIGIDPKDYTHPDDLGPFLTLLNDLLQKPGGSFTTQYRFRHKDGSWRWLESTVSNLLAEPWVKAIVFNYRDITERKQAEEALRNAEARYRILFEQSPNGVLLIDLETGKTIEANETAHKQLGYTCEEFAALRISDYEVLEKPEEAARRMQKIIREGSDDFEALHRTKSGEIRNMHVRVKTVQLNDRALFYGIVQDITERKEAEKRIETQLQRLAALRTIDTAITGSLDLRLTLGIVLDQVTAQLNVDAADVLLFNPHLQTLEYAAARGFRTKAFKGAQLSLGEGYAGRAALERHSVHIPNLDNQYDNPRLAKHLASEGFVAYYGLPLIAKGRVKGVLEVFQRAPLAAGPDWINFLETLAGQAAIAIDNAQLFDNLERSNVELSLAYDATIAGWSQAMDLRDKETEGHTQRVAEMSQRLARVIGIDEAELVNMRRGALLHDIGKMGVPDSILLKPGKLTDEEWTLMKKHPQFAFDMLSPIAYLKPALDIPYYHHEKWDGTGYPQGLKGEQIPLAARIFSVVDVWDAVTSDRPYRKAWTKKKTFTYIREQSGTHFDPAVVDVFLSSMDNFDEQ